MKKRICCVLLTFLLLFSYSMPALAEIRAGTAASFIQYLDLADSFIEATVLSVSRFSFPNAEEKIEYDDTTIHNVTISVDANLRGDKINEKKLKMVVWFRGNVRLKEGQRYILTLNKNDEAWRKEMAESKGETDYDPGPYSLVDAFLINENGSLTGLSTYYTYEFSSFAAVVTQMEGLAPSRGLTDDMEYYSVMYYNGEMIQRAFARRKATVYSLRDLKSKTILTLQPYDFVLKIGEEDDIYGKKWDKILLADGMLGFLLAGSLEAMPYSLWHATNTLIKTPKTMPLYTILGEKYAKGRLVGGTAAVLEDSGPIYENTKEDYLRVNTGMQTDALVEKWDYERMDRPMEVSMTAGAVYLNEDEEIPDIAILVDVNEGASYQIYSADKRITLYSEPSLKSEKLASIPKNAYFTRVDVGTKIKKEGKLWTRIEWIGETYALQGDSTPYGDAVVDTGEFYYPEKNAYLYRYDGYAFTMDKTAFAYRGFSLLVDEKAVVNGKTYYRLAGGEEDALWVRNT